MKARLYIETTVVSYYAARPSRDVVIAGHQQATQDLWSRFGHHYEPYVSALVVREAGKGDPRQAQGRLAAISPFPVLDVDVEAEALAAKLMTGKAVPEEYPEDALHVALATVNGMEVLVTWNFSHLNNPFSRVMIRQIVENEGYTCPEIVSPDELVGDES